jgi:phosphatidylglycerol---prolipoprotein diacylglyceryl transferase
MIIPNIIYLGPVVIHLYGLMIGLSLWIGLEVAVRAAKRHGLQPEKLYQLAWWAILPGVVGARLYHVVDQWAYYSEHLGEIIAVWRGGLAIYGAIMGGLIGVGLLALWQKWLDRNRSLHHYVWKGLLDSVALGLPWGQAIGRWGNYLNQELYGRPTTLSWGIYIDPEHRLAGYEDFTRFQPLFLYESVLMVGVGLGLRWLERSQKLPWGKGLYFALYLMAYGVIRFSLESLRIISWKYLGLSVAQAISLGVVGLGSLWLYKGTK